VLGDDARDQLGEIDPLLAHDPLKPPPVLGADEQPSGYGECPLAFGHVDLRFRRGFR
jgi:hypothetical protein